MEETLVFVVDVFGMFRCIYINLTLFKLKKKNQRVRQTTATAADPIQATIISITLRPNAFFHPQTNYFTGCV